jgi:hypothetical protein
MKVFVVTVDETVTFLLMRTCSSELIVLLIVNKIFEHN